MIQRYVGFRVYHDSMVENRDSKPDDKQPTALGLIQDHLRQGPSHHRYHELEKLGAEKRASTAMQTMKTTTQAA